MPGFVGQAVFLQVGGWGGWTFCLHYPHLPALPSAPHPAPPSPTLPLCTYYTYLPYLLPFLSLCVALPHTPTSLPCPYLPPARPALPHPHLCLPVLPRNLPWELEVDGVGGGPYLGPLPHLPFPFPTPYTTHTYTACHHHYSPPSSPTTSTYLDLPASLCHHPTHTLVCRKVWTTHHAPRSLQPCHLPIPPPLPAFPPLPASSTPTLPLDYHFLPLLWFPTPSPPAPTVAPPLLTTTYLYTTCHCYPALYSTTTTLLLPPPATTFVSLWEFFL